MRNAAICEDSVDACRAAPRPPGEEEEEEEEEEERNRGEGEEGSGRRDGMSQVPICCPR
jgi:hypothetical protein